MRACGPLWSARVHPRWLIAALLLSALAAPAAAEIRVRCEIRSFGLIRTAQEVHGERASRWRPRTTGGLCREVYTECKRAIAVANENRREIPAVIVRKTIGPKGGRSLQFLQS